MMFFFRASSGLLLWSAGFSALYGLHGLGCELGWQNHPLFSSTVFALVLLATWAAFLLAGVGVLFWSLRLAAPPFERRLTQACAATGLVALVLSGAPIALISACV